MKKKYRLQESCTSGGQRATAKVCHLVPAVPKEVDFPFALSLLSFNRGQILFQIPREIPTKLMRRYGIHVDRYAEIGGVVDKILLDMQQRSLNSLLSIKY